MMHIVICINDALVFHKYIYQGNDYPNMKIKIIVKKNSLIICFDQIRIKMHVFSFSMYHDLHAIKGNTHKRYQSMKSFIIQYD